MSGGYNKCTFVGNLGKDVEMRSLPGGEAVASFSVGANESWKDKAGNKREHCEWVNCSLFGKRAEGLSQYLTKGTRVLVEGRLRTDKYEKDGETRYATKLIVSDVVLLGSPKGDGEAPRANGGSRYGTSGSGGSAKHSEPKQQGFGDALDDEEIPFIRNEAIFGDWDRP